MDKQDTSINSYNHSIQLLERKFVFHGSRNMLDEFTGRIIGIYPAIFTILDSNGVLKSFSYSDLLIGNLEIL